MPIDPQNGAAQKIDEALSFHRQGRLKEAEEIYRAVLADNASNPDAHHLLGMALFAQGQLELAHQHIHQAITLSPSDERYYLNLANILRAMGHIDEAITTARQATALKPDYAEAWFNGGLLLARLGRFSEALDHLEHVVRLSPSVPDVWFHRGAILQELGRHDDAISSFDKVITLNPVAFNAYGNRGIALGQLGRHEDALQSFDAAIALKSDQPLLHYNRGNALHTLKRYTEALQAYDETLKLSPDDAQAHYNRGVTQSELRRYDEALSSYDRAISLNPNHAEAHNNRGNALSHLQRRADAIESYNRAIALKPDYAEAYNNRGNALNDLKRYDEALASYDKALALNPSIDLLPGAVLTTRMLLCQWTELETSVGTIFTGLDAGKNVITPFALLSLPSTLRQQRTCASIHARHVTAQSASAFVPLPRPPSRKIRLGYFSPDFRPHPVSYLTAGLFEQHDREQFEVYAFSYGARTADPFQRRIESAFGHFFDVRMQSDQAVVAQARDLGLDIAIDLAGYTLGARSDVFAARVAPVQVNYLGYPGTMAVNFMDYIIADDIVIPPSHRCEYAEKVVILPDTFQVNDAKRPIGQTPTRSQLGFTESAVIFCSFNNVYKFNPATFSLWMNILRKAENAVLWLPADNQTQIANLKAFASRNGVDPARLFFAGRVPDLGDHLARYQVADIALDTAPFNGHTTTSDALWAGTPVLTWAGETFAGRVAASLLHAVGLSELIAESAGAYEALAVELAHNPTQIRALKQKLAGHRLYAPLFDAAKFTRHLEGAYKQMCARADAGHPPDHIRISGV